jgi:ABC-type phosphate transport system substrate-binding protein
MWPKSGGEYRLDPVVTAGELNEGEQSMLLFGRRKSTRRGIRVGTAASATALAIGVLAVSAGGASAAPTCGGAAIAGQGSSLQGSAQTELWASASGGYNAACGKEQVKYTVSSSGTGLSSWGFNAGAFENKWSYVGTDDGPTSTQINNAKTASGTNVLVIPVAQTAIGIVVNPPTNCSIEEITNKQLESVMRGNLKIWNKIQTASGAGCVNAPITRVVRAEGSGTTFQVKNYLSLINAAALACTEGGKTWKQLEENGTGGKPNIVWPENGIAGCAANAVSPIVTAAGGGGVVKKVNVTEGGIGYAALPDIEKNKGNGENKAGDTNWIKVQNNGVSNKLANAQTASPLEELGNSAQCTSTQYPVPTVARVGSANPANADWSQVFGANPNIAGATGNTEAYPLCTLTYDVALTNYSKAGFSEASEITAKDYLANYLTAEEGQEALEVGGKWYAPLPNPAAASINVLGAAKLAASKIGF